MFFYRMFLKLRVNISSPDIAQSAPVELLQNPPARLIQPKSATSRTVNMFVVYLKRHRTLTDHLNWIGLSLPEITDTFSEIRPPFRQGFDPLFGKIAYYVELPLSVVTNLILYDPNVQRVEQFREKR